MPRNSLRLLVVTSVLTVLAAMQVNAAVPRPALLLSTTASQAAQAAPGSPLPVPFPPNTVS
jgi:hypothetical protein